MRPLAAQLKVQIRTYMIKFVAAHGRDAVKPKHHELLHVPRQLLRDLALLTCWTAERKHKTTLEIMGPIDNTRSYEKTSIGRLLAAQVSQLDKFRGVSYLEDPVSTLRRPTMRSPEALN